MTQYVSHFPFQRHLGSVLVQNTDFPTHNCSHWRPIPLPLQATCFSMRVNLLGIIWDDCLKALGALRDESQSNGYREMEKQWDHDSSVQSHMQSTPGTPRPGRPGQGGQARAASQPESNSVKDRSAAPTKQDGSLSLSLGGPRHEMER